VLTARTLKDAMPTLPWAKAVLYAPFLSRAMKAGRITTPKRAHAFLAQLAHESGDLRWMEELASGAEYEGRRDLGNIYYGDGKRYKGRGPIQLTGRTNYIRAGEALGVNLVDHPARAARPRYAFRVATWFWTTHGLNELADRDDFETITRRINGGLNGYEDRKRRWAHIKTLGRKVVP
jgi:putative chitinase